MYNLSLEETIILMEADSVFDKENFSAKDEAVLGWLKQLKGYKNIEDENKKRSLIIPEKYTVSVTGHRPPKLYGYDLSDPRWQTLKMDIIYHLLCCGCTEAITGMALGVDLVFALAVIDLKNTGHNIYLECAVPCLKHTSPWKDKQVLNLYNYICSKADKVTIVTKTEYTKAVMQKRNEYMVDKADEILAVWDGTKGGTGNCIEYAEKKKKKITNIYRPELINNK